MSVSLSNPRKQTSLSVKSLGITLAKSVRKPLPKKASRQEKQARHITEKWCNHLDGNKLLEKEEKQIEKFKKEDITPEIISEWLKTESGFASCYIKRNHWKTNIIELFDLDDYQVDFLDNQSKYSIYRKARRCGLSLSVSARGLIRMHLDIARNSFIVSKTHEEAMDKINYAVEMWHTMPPDIRLPLGSKALKSKLELYDKTSKTNRFIKSHPQTEPRGIEGDIYLDEFAFYQQQELIYTAAANAIVRLGSVWIISTPRNKGDLFYKINEGERSSKAFGKNIFTIPWWRSRIMVAEGKFELVAKVAPEMTTKSRVYDFGSPSLIDTYESNITEGDFQVEYECQYNDDANSLYPDEILNGCIYPLVDKGYIESLEDETPISFPIESKLKKLGVHNSFCYTIDELVHDIDMSLIGKSLVMAIDPGFTDGCSIMIAEELPGPFAIVRFNIKLIRVSYHKRENYILSIGKRLPIRMTAIDCKDGEGIALASKLSNSPVFGSHRIEKIYGSAAKNSDMSIHLRRRMELQMIAIPDLEPLKKDIKKAKRDFTSNGEPTISVVRDKDGHGDRFYTLMYLDSILDPIDGASNMMHIPDAVNIGVPVRRFVSKTTNTIPNYHKILAGKKIVKSAKISDFDHISIDQLDISQLPIP